MKKLLALLLVSVLAFSLVACTGTEETVKSDTSSDEALVTNDVKETDTATTAKEEPGTEPSSEEVTSEQAEDIALKHAGLKRSEVTYIRSSLDYDDGYKLYEVEFYKDRFEYDYDVDAVSGKILSFDKDYDD